MKMKFFVHYAVFIAACVLTVYSQTSSMCTEAGVINSLSGTCRTQVNNVRKDNPSVADVNLFCNGDCLNDLYCALKTCNLNSNAAGFRTGCATKSMNQRCGPFLNPASATYTAFGTQCTTPNANCTSSMACRTAVTNLGCCATFFRDTRSFPLDGCGVSECSDLRNLKCGSVGRAAMPLMIVASLLVTFVGLM